MSEIYNRPPVNGPQPNGPLVIGIDAGGTSSRACLAEARIGGAVLGRGAGGPGNALTVGRADLTLHLTDAVAEAVPPELRARVAAVFGGFAGAAEGLGPERGKGLALSCVRDALSANGITGAAVGVGGDTEVALASAPGAPADGLVLIAGTGAISTRLTGRRRTAVVDGHGWLLGDEGSGYWLGGHAVRAALEALDGRGPWTALVGLVAAHYLGDEAADVGPSAGFERRDELSEGIVTRAYAQPPAALARLSRAAVTAAGQGDATALRLLDRAAELLAGTVAALDPRAGEPLVLTGGLLGPRGPLLSRVTALLERYALQPHPTSDGTTGAAALACRLL
jgi:N-acetylglucosamine kinase-like BadF-type ATPase